MIGLRQKGGQKMREKRCAGCRFAVPIYMGDGDELMTACVYILRTGRRRPCPPGEACRVYEPAVAGVGTVMEGKESMG